MVVGGLQGSLRHLVGSVALVDAHRGLCLLAPRAISLSARSVANSCSNASDASRALATPAVLSSECASAETIAPSRLSISASTRETTTDATDQMLVRSIPAALACSRPVGWASITPRKRSRLKMSVTLMLIPPATAVVMAGKPSTVAGIVMKAFGRLIFARWRFASSTVAGASPVVISKIGSAPVDPAVARAAAWVS